jgi:hypothetical protein
MSAPVRAHTPISERSTPGDPSEAGRIASQGAPSLTSHRSHLPERRSTVTDPLRACTTRRPSTRRACTSPDRTRRTYVVIALESISGDDSVSVGGPAARPRRATRPLPTATMPSPPARAGRRNHRDRIGRLHVRVRAAAGTGVDRFPTACGGGRRYASTNATMRPVPLTGRRQRSWPHSETLRSACYGCRDHPDQTDPRTHRRRPNPSNRHQNKCGDGRFGRLRGTSRD